MSRWFFAAVPLSLWVSWAAWRGPPPPIRHETPAPLERLSSPKERRAVLESASLIAAAIQRSKLARGSAIQSNQLEALDENGIPFLEHPIPDNPLMPGIASIAEHCPADSHASQMDWVYCPSTGNFLPVVNGQSVSGNE